ncbi:MAG: lipopolysaccharide heptosyltransferase II [Proteobacteria bacterium]|nr:lipopolysaccharide heptosyltransferase II [Pseudomonadota bacterium]
MAGVVIRIKRCLIVGPSWVGDMVMAQSLFKRLKADNPALYLAVLAPAWSEALLAHMPEVDESIIMPVGHKQVQLGARWHLARGIKQKGFDQAIVLPGSLKSALIPFFAGIPRRTGFLGEQRYGLLNDYRKLDKAALPLNVERFLVLGSAQNVLPEQTPKPALRVDETARDAVREKYALNTEKPMLALCPGAEFGPAKQWPAKHYASVAQQKLNDGWQVVLLGSAADKAICAEINDANQGKCEDLSGRTSLTEVIDVLSLGDYVVSNDSGLMHIAAALERPLVAIYGSSSPDFTPPLSENCAMLKLELECQPCFKRECPLGHLNCLNELLPETVLAAMNRTP